MFFDEPVLCERQVLLVVQLDELAVVVHLVLRAYDEEVLCYTVVVRERVRSSFWVELAERLKQKTHAVGLQDFVRVMKRDETVNVDEVFCQLVEGWCDAFDVNCVSFRDVFLFLILDNRVVCVATEVILVFSCSLLFRSTSFSSTPNHDLESILRQLR